MVFYSIKEKYIQQGKHLSFANVEIIKPLLSMFCPK